MNIPLDENRLKESVIVLRSALSALQRHLHRSDHTVDTTRSSNSVAQSDCTDDRSDEEDVGMRMQQSLESAECLLQHGRQRMIVGGGMEQGPHPANRHRVTRQSGRDSNDDRS